MNQPNQMQNVVAFAADSLPIGVLLSQFTMTIPDMQRPYAWTKTQAGDLIRDLERLLHLHRSGLDNHKHYFGSLVVLITGQREEVVDGQQRLTTVSTLLGVIQQALMDLERAIVGAGGPQAAVNAQNCAAIRTGIRPKLRRPGPIVPGVPNQEIPVLEVSPEIRDMFMALTDIDSPEVDCQPFTPAAHLRDVAKEFKDRLILDAYNGMPDPLDRLRHLQMLSNAVESGLMVVRLGTQTASAAYELFESLNARGLNLNALDLVKVWMLAVLSKEGVDSREVAHTMRQLTSGDIEKQIDFFEDFYYARAQRKPRDGRNEYKVLASDARRYLFRDPEYPNQPPQGNSLSDRIVTEARRMLALADPWQDLRGLTSSADRVPRQFHEYRNYEWLRFRLNLLLGQALGHRGPIYPLLMVASDKYRERPDDFLQLVHLIERFFFRFRVICGVSEERVGEFYMSLIRQMEANDQLDFPTVVAQARDYILEYATDELFEARLGEKIRLGEPINRVKYFFNMLEIYSYDPKPIMRTVALNQWRVEPVESVQNLVNKGVEESVAISLGNICLLDPVPAMKLGGLGFGQRKTLLAELAGRSGPNRVEIDDASSRAVFSGPEEAWGEDEIRARDEVLRRRAREIFTPTLPLIERF